MEYLCCYDAPLSQIAKLLFRNIRRSEPGVDTLCRFFNQIVKFVLHNLITPCPVIFLFAKKSIVHLLSLFICRGSVRRYGFLRMGNIVLFLGSFSAVFLLEFEFLFFLLEIFLVLSLMLFLQELPIRMIFLGLLNSGRIAGVNTVLLQVFVAQIAFTKGLIEFVGVFPDFLVSVQLKFLLSMNRRCHFL